MDIHTKEQRSYNMSQVKSKNTKPERLMFSFLNKSGYRFRRHYSIIGKPDIAFPRYKIAVFIDGEFWHGKGFNGWKDKLTPFWLKKIDDNIIRDKYNRKLLSKNGWKVIHLWGKAILKNPDKEVLKITKILMKKQIDN